MKKTAINQVKAVAFDLDGTIYYGNSLISGAKELVRFLQDKGIKVIYFTNNSMRTKRDIYEKLLGMGLELNREDVYNSAYATAVYAKYMGIKKAYCIGSEGLIKELEASGVYATENDKQAEALIVGLDTGFDYNKLSIALALLTRKCFFIACNLDRNYPVENGILLPGCGPIISAIQFSYDRKPDFVVGKPNTYMLELLAKDHNIAVRDILVVGDTYDSDIAMAKKSKCLSILISNKDSGYEDTLVVKNARDIMHILES